MPLSYEKNKKHRDGDKPAVIFDATACQYWIHGKKHRDGNKPAEIDTGGHFYYYNNGKKYVPKS